MSSKNETQQHDWMYWNRVVVRNWYSMCTDGSYGMIMTTSGWDGQDTAYAHRKFRHAP